jgi:transglutaminase-like putative cysteine protease
MSARRHDIEALLLPMFAALPLYATDTIGMAPLLVFHAVMAAMVVRVARGKQPDIIRPGMMKALAIGYIGFYVIDLVAISRDAISSSTHLALFIAAYQPIEGMSRDNHGQRLLSAAMLFVASIATATHITIVPYVIAFAFLIYRQLIHASRADSLASIGLAAPSQAVGRAAGFYVGATSMLAIALFPVLPRVRNPFVPGMTGALGNAATGLSDTIDFREPRSIEPDPSVVSRVWLGYDAIRFFTPIRLRGAIYDRFQDSQWRQTERAYIPVSMREGAAHVAVPAGLKRVAQVQQRLIVHGRLLLPVGTFAVSGAGQVYEGPTRDVFQIFQLRKSESVTYEVSMARSTLPLHDHVVHVTNYPVTKAVAAMARQIAGRETDPMAQAGAIEHYMSTRFRYIPNPALIGHTMSVDSFLLREHRGHCEYFAAGMVALLTSLNVPARIVGGFYGGTRNPLTGYYVIRREDAHAWVEVWDGKGWQTFDPTPSSLRPGNSQAGLLKIFMAALGDSINYFWDRYILTFGLGDQIALVFGALQSLRDSGLAFQKATQLTLRSIRIRGVVEFAALAMVAILLMAFIARRRRSLFALLAARLHELGIEVSTAMTLEEALNRLRITHPDDAIAMAPLIALYEEERFSSRQDRARAAVLRRRLSDQ